MIKKEKGHSCIGGVEMRLKKIVSLCVAAVMLFSSCGKNVSDKGAPESNAKLTTGYAAKTAVLQWQGQVLTAISLSADSKQALCEGDDGSSVVVNIKEDGNVESGTVLQTADDRTPMAIARGIIASYRLISTNEDGIHSELSVDTYREDGTIQEHLFSLENEGCPLFLTEYQGGYVLGINQEPSLDICRQADKIVFWKDNVLTECSMEMDAVYSALSVGQGILLSGGVQNKEEVGAEATWRYGVYLWDPATQKTELLMELADKTSLLCADSATVYAVDSRDVVSLNLDSGKEEVQIDQIETGAANSYLGGWYERDNCLLFLDNGTIAILEENNEIDTRETVVLGYMYDLSVAEESIYTFNSSSDRYWIELQRYEDIAELGIAISSGQSPDLMDTTFVPVDSYLGKGAFADVADIVQKSGYLKSLQNLVSQDGAIFIVPIRFSMWTTVMREDYVEKYKQLTLKDLAGLSSDELLINEPLATLISTISWTASENDTKEMLKSILQITQMQQSADASAQAAVQLPYAIYDFGTVEEMQRYRKGYSIAGWPGCGAEGIAVYPMGELAVCSKGKNQEGARTVLEFMLSSEGQETMDPYSIGVTETVFANQLQKSADAGMSQEAGEQVAQMVNSAEILIREDKTILGIVEEEAQPYLTGDKTAEECVEIIINRVNTYLEE